MFSSVQNRFKSTLSYFGYGSETSRELPEEVLESLEKQLHPAGIPLHERRITSKPPSIWKRVASLGMSYFLFSIGQSSLQETLSSGIRCYGSEPWVLPLTFVAGLSIFPEMAHAQTTFFEAFGGAGSEEVRAITTTSEGDFIVTGHTNSFGVGGNDVLLSKFSSNGMLAWANILGGVGGIGFDGGRALATAPDGDLIVAGDTYSVGAGDFDVLLSKFSSNGTLLWANTLGGAITERGNALMVTSDGDLIIAGSTNSFGAGGYDVLLSKFSGNGTLLWAKTIGGAGSEVAHALTATPEGDLIVTGYADNIDVGGVDVLLSKFSSNGTLLWAKNLVGGANTDMGNALTTTTEGDLIVLGHTLSFGAGGSDVLLSKFSSNGTLLWANTLGGTSNDYGKALRVTSEGDVIVAGYTLSFGAGGEDVLLSKFSSNGTLGWVNTLGGAINDRGISLTVTSEGDLVIAGYTSSFGAGSDDILLAKLNAQGSMGNCSPWQSVTPQVQSITSIVTDVTLNMTAGIPPWTSQDARSALNLTDITNLLNQTTVCHEQISASRTLTTSPQASLSSQTPSELSQDTKGSASISRFRSMTRSALSTTRNPIFSSTRSTLASSLETPDSLSSSSKTLSERSRDTGISIDISSFQSNTPSFSSPTFSSTDITNHQSSTMQNSHSLFTTGPLLSNQIVYGMPIEILVGGQVVGIFTFSGGEGTLDSENSNTLTIELNEDFYPEDGQEITLFITSDGEWGNVEVISYGRCEEGTGYEASGVFSEDDDDTQRFLLVFEVTSCTSVQATKIFNYQVLSTAFLFG